MVLSVFGLVVAWCLVDFLAEGMDTLLRYLGSRVKTKWSNSLGSEDDSDRYWGQAESW